MEDDLKKNLKNEDDLKKNEDNLKKNEDNLQKNEDNLNNNKNEDDLKKNLKKKTSKKIKPIHQQQKISTIKKINLNWL